MGRSFWRLWAATTASGLATWAFPFVLGLGVARGELSATALGLLLGVRTVGFLLAVPWGGVLADRFSRRAVVVVAGGAAGLATPLVSMLEAPVALAAAAVVGAGQGAVRPAHQALVADLVAPERRRRANALVSLAVRTTTLAGPAVAALGATVLGLDGLLLAVAALWVLTAAATPGGRRPEVGGARTSYPRQLVEGLEEARRHRWFLGGLGALAVVILTGYSVTGVLLPAVVADRAEGVLLLSAAGTAYVGGALLGAVVMARWDPTSVGWVALAGLALYAASPAALALDAAAWVVVATYALAGLGIEVFNVLWFTAVQDQVPPERLARVSSLDFLVSYGLAPVGLALIVPAAAAAGAVPVLWVCVAACLVAPAAAAAVPGARSFRDPAVGGSGVGTVRT